MAHPKRRLAAVSAAGRKRDACECKRSRPGFAVSVNIVKAEGLCPWPSDNTGRFCGQWQDQPRILEYMNRSHASACSACVVHIAEAPTLAAQSIIRWRRHGNDLLAPEGPFLEGQACVDLSSIAIRGSWLLRCRTAGGIGMNE